MGNRGSSRRFSRRGVLAGMGGLAAAPGAVPGAAKPPGGQRPNIIIIQMDDMRSADWPLLRRTRKVLRGARWFPSYVVGYSYCAPSRASLLTGQYAHNHGVVAADQPTVYAQWRGPNHDRGAIGAVLRAAGYRTAAIGKYMNGYSVKDGPLPGWNRWAVVDSHEHFGPRIAVDGDVVETPREVFGLEALAGYVSEFVSSVPADAPFFLLFSPVEPHGPIRTERSTRRLFKRVMLPRTPAFNEADVSDKPDYISSRPLLDQATTLHLEEWNRGRMRMMDSADRIIARMLGEMQAAGRLDNAVVFVLSDNGYLLGEHRLSAKHAPYTPSVVIPMLAWGRGFHAGRDLRLVSNVDIAPTCAELAGTRMPAADGVSLLGPRRRDFVPMMRDGHAGLPGEPGAGHGIRSRDLFYYELLTGERELYDLRADPMELDNLLPPGFTGEAYPPGLPSSLALRDLAAAIGSCRGESCTRAG